MIARRLAKIIVQRPKTVLLVYTIITLIIGINIKNVYMQSDLSNFLPDNDPSLQIWGKINQEFKIGSTIIIIVDQKDRLPDENLGNPDVLSAMDKVAKYIDRNPEDKGEQDGVITVRSIAQIIKDENNDNPTLNSISKGENGYQIPKDSNIIWEYMSRTSVESMKGVLFTDDYKFAVIIIQLSENANFNEVLDRAHKAVELYGNKATDMTVTGGVAVGKAIRDETFRSLNIVFALAMLFVALNIYFFHRNLKSFVISFLPLAFSIALTFGVLGIVQPGLTILSIAAVALLIGLGDDYSVYYSSRFAEESNVEDKIQRVEYTLSHTGKAVFMCAIATMIGFGSLMTSNMPPMVAFGFVCLLGTFFVLLSATILVPCLCLLLKFEHREKSHHWKRFANFVVDHRKRFFAVGCIFVVLSLLLLPQVRTDVDFYKMAPKNLPEIEELFSYSEKLGQGANFNALLVETESGGLTDLKTIEAIYNMSQEIRKQTEEVGEKVTVISIADPIMALTSQLERLEMLKQLADLAVNLTDLQKLIDLPDVEKVLFDKIANENLVSKDYSKTVILVSIPVGKSVQELEKIVNIVNNIVSNTRLPHNGHVSQLAGQDVVTVEVNKQIMSTQTSSMIIELLLILTCLIIGFGSTKVGLLSLIPVLFVLAWEPGSLVMLDIPLSVMNITVAAIVVSTGIDYGIVITQRLKEERANGSSKVDALKTTVETSGWSILTASSTTMVALLATFAVDIPMLHQFSIIVILLYLLAIIASFCIIPYIYASRWFE